MQNETLTKPHIQAEMKMAEIEAWLFVEFEKLSSERCRGMLTAPSPVQTSSFAIIPAANA